MQFTDLRLSPAILRALTREGYQTPTPIQAKAIPHILDGRDVLGCARTGTGKTAAFALPVLQRLMAAPANKDRRGPTRARALVLSPTRELAAQISDAIRVYGAESGLRHTVIFGGVGQGAQVRDLKNGVDIIVATPGRLIDLMEQGYVVLSEVQTLVLDEADRMLDMGFIEPIRRIASATPEARQTLLFSATMPREVAKLADSLLREPVRVAVDPVATAAPMIEQTLYHVSRSDKQALLATLLLRPEMTRTIVFTKTKHGADRVGKRLSRAGIFAETIHGDKAQNARMRAMSRFRSGQARVLVATDVAARGIDVDGISHVVNFDLPMDPEAYVHRIGRTGRAGAAGIALSFCDAEERGLLRGIERMIGARIPQVALPAIDRRADIGDHAPAPHRAGDDDRGRPGARPPHAGGKPPQRPAKGQPKHRSGHAPQAELAGEPGAGVVRGPAAARSWPKGGGRSRRSAYGPNGRARRP